MKSFMLSMSIDATLTVDELWPDGDAPENPTSKDVEDLIEKCGGWLRIIDDWSLADRFSSGTVTDDDEIKARLAALRADAAARKVRP